MVALGRHVEHDPRSKLHPARRAARPRTVLWDHHAPVLDQLDLGSCTGHALAQCLNTTKFANSRPNRRYLDHRAAVDLYSVATGLDDIDGTYPPLDSGSSSLGVCKAGVRLGYLSAYHHTFAFDDFLGALALQPVITGVNWYDGMFDVDMRGFIRPTGQLAGGHEFVILGANVRSKYVVMLNSWGPAWGRKGRAYISFEDFQGLLNEQGDVTVPVGVR